MTSFIQNCFQSDILTCLLAVLYLFTTIRGCMILEFYNQSDKVDRDGLNFHILTLLCDVIKLQINHFFLSNKHSFAGTISLVVSPLLAIANQMEADCQRLGISCLNCTKVIQLDWMSTIFTIGASV